MFVTRIVVTKDGYSPYSYAEPKADAPYSATIETKGKHGKVELNLSPELSRRVVEIIADEVAAAGRATAEAMVAECITGTALPAPEAVS